MRSGPLEDAGALRPLRHSLEIARPAFAQGRLRRLDVLRAPADWPKLLRGIGTWLDAGCPTSRAKLPPDLHQTGSGKAEGRGRAVGLPRQRIWTSALPSGAVQSGPRPRSEVAIFGLMHRSKTNAIRSPRRRAKGARVGNRGQWSLPSLD